MSSPSNLVQSLSPFQRRLVATALAMVAAAVIAFFFFGLFLLLRGFVGTFSSVLWPLAVAGILALILKPVVLWFERRLKFTRIWSIVAIYGLVLVATLLVVAMVVPVLFEQLLSFSDKLPVIWLRLQELFAEKFPQVQAFLYEHVGQERLERYLEALNSQAEKLFAWLLPAAQDLAGRMQGAVALLTGLAIIPVYLFFFLKTDRDPTADLGDQISFVREEWRGDIVFLVREFASSMEAFFRGQILIGLIMGILLAIGFSFAGVNFGIGLGLMIGGLNIIPYFGTIIGLATVLPIAYLQPDGGFSLMLVALGIFVAVQMLEGYFLTPRIMGEQTGLHPLTIIIAIFFWGVALDGLLGMVLAIPLTAFFVVVWRLAKRKYLARIMNDGETTGPNAFVL